jgi:thiamine-monophosphate kinase
MLKPEARKDIIEFFAKSEILPTSMIDISDGLGSEILHICKESQLGCVLYEEKIPVAEEMKKAAFKFKIDPTVCALSGGEDYELLFTIRQEDHDKLLLNEEIDVVGYMAEPEKGAHIITKGGNTHAITAQGWQHLEKRS